MSINLSNLASTTGNILSLFDTWDLQNVTYNGVNIVVFSKSGITALNNILNTAQTAKNTATALFGGATQNASPPFNNYIPNGSFTGLQEFDETYSIDIDGAVNKARNSNVSDIIHQGWRVPVYTGVGIFSGASCETLWDTFKKYALVREGDPLATDIGKELYVFHTPSGERIENALMIEFKRKTLPKPWRSIIINFTVIATEIPDVVPKGRNLANLLNTAFNTVIAAANDISLIYNLLKSYAGQLSSVFGSKAPSGAKFMSNVMPQIEKTPTLLLSTSTILYNNFAPKTYENYGVASYSIDYSQFPLLASYATSSDKDAITGMLSLYFDLVDGIIDIIDVLGISINVYNIVQSLINSKASLLSLAQTIAVNSLNQFISYVTPYDMTTIEICAKNQLDFNNPSILQAINNDNVSIINSNMLIPEGTNILIRKNYD